MKGLKPITWLAEYNSECVAKVKAQLGPPDADIERISRWISANGFDKNSSFLKIDATAGSFPIFFQALMLYYKFDFSNITELHLFNCTAFKDSECQHIQRLKNLNRIKIQSCNGIGNAGIKDIVAHQAGVTGFSLNACKRVGDEGLLVVSRACPKIQSMSITECNLISDIGLKYLSEGCKDIEELNLTRCSNITDQGIFYLVSGSKTLQKLTLAQCKVQIFAHPIYLVANHKRRNSTPSELSFS